MVFQMYMHQRIASNIIDELQKLSVTNTTAPQFVVVRTLTVLISRVFGFNWCPFFQFGQQNF